MKSIISNALRKVLPEIVQDVAASVCSYRRVHGVYPNLIWPRNFNEKVIARSLFDRRPILRQFADKYAVRSFVSERLGASALPEVFWVTNNPGDIPFAQLPSSFVVKPTHGSSWVRVVRDKQNLDQQELIRECEYWLSQDYSKRHRERVYKGVPPRILVEELIDDGSAGAPTDYKFMVFHGKVEVILVVANRYANISACWLDREWRVLKAGFIRGSATVQDQFKNFPRPPHLEELIAAAENLGRDIDFVRADFYDTACKYYFGELTTTPAAGLEKFDPPEFNTMLGRLW